MVYARVSSKEQEKEGFSIPAQLKLLKEHAAAPGFAVAKEYVDVETATQTGHAAFGEMIAHLRAQPSIPLGEKIEAVEGIASVRRSLVGRGSRSPARGASAVAVGNSRSHILVVQSAQHWQAHLPEFWQQGDEREGQHRADAWHRGQQLIALSESTIGGNHLGQALVEEADIGLQSRLATFAEPPEHGIFEMSRLVLGRNMLVTQLSPHGTRRLISKKIGRAHV